MVKSKRCNTCARPLTIFLLFHVTLAHSYGFTPSANAAAGIDPPAFCTDLP
jgi:hypothetical protein